MLYYKPQQALYYWGIRSMAMWFVWAVAAFKLKEKSLIPWFPFFDIGWMMYNFAFSPYIVLKNKTQWK